MPSSAAFLELGLNLSILEISGYTLGQRETLFADDAIRLFSKRLNGAHNHAFGNNGEAHSPKRTSDLLLSRSLESKLFN
jgi:hypothetical protein